MSPLRLYPLVLSTAAAASVFWFYVVRGRRKTPEQREQERRQRIAAIGRITDGTVIDVCEVPAQTPTAAHATQLLVFHYDVAGVTYEASQDITNLRQFIDLHNCRLGIPTSVKYDPQNPGNSIVIAEGWAGLRNSRTTRQ